MGRCNRVAQRACRVVADYNRIDIVATRRTYIIASRYVRYATQIRRKIAKKPAACSGGLAGIHCPLVGRPVNLTKVVDAGVSLRGGTRFHEVGDGNSRKEADDAYDDHELHQGKTRLADVLGACQ